MLCPFCGTENDSTKTECRACGRSLSAETNDGDAAYSFLCSAPGWRCPQCGAAVPQGRSVCPVCGKPAGMIGAGVLPPQTLPPVAIDAIKPAPPVPQAAPGEPACPMCGAAVREGAPFCPECGTPLPKP